MRKQRFKNNRRATIAEVARHADVSAATVSRVVNGATNVLDETKARVMLSIEALGYIPNTAAQNLAGNGAIRVGVLCGNPSANYTSQFLLALLEHGIQGNCQLLVQKCERPGSEVPIIENMLKNGVDGVLLPPPLCDSSAIISMLAAADLPFVGVGTARPEVQGLSVCIDNVAATAEITRYLLSLGHRDIGFIKGPAKQLDSAQRFEGFAIAMGEAGLQPNPDWLKIGQYTYQSGIKAAEALLESRIRPTAILASNDDMAAAVVAVAHRLSLDVPRDLSVAGFDDTPIATVIWPALTTVRQPVAKMAGMALDLIREEVLLRRGGGTLGAQRRRLKSTLIRRGSSSPPQ